MPDLLCTFDATAFAREELGFAADEVQQRVLDVAAKRGIVCCTRQWGKTSVTAVKAVHHCWHNPGSLVLVASPSERQSQIFLHAAKKFVRRLGVEVRGDGENSISVLLPNGSRIVGLPGCEGTTRGFSNPGLLVIDEAALVSDEMYDSLVPMLATGNGALWLLSTPRGKRGFFWREWNSGGPEWRRVSVPAWECPRIAQSFLEEERRRKSERIFQQEYGCVFLEADGALFRDEDLTACVDGRIPALFAGELFPPTQLQRHSRYFVGVDLGQSQDYSAITVVEKAQVVYPERDPRTWAFRTETRFALRFAERVPLGTAYTFVADEVRALVQRAPLKGNVTVVLDGTGVGAPVVDLLKKGGLGCRVMPVAITGGVIAGSDGNWYRVPKADLIGGLQSGFERRMLRMGREIGAFDELLEELRGMRVKRGVRYSGAVHDDLVMSLALAWWRARAEGS